MATTDAQLPSIGFTFYWYIGGGAATDYQVDGEGQFRTRSNPSGMGFFSDGNALLRIPFKDNQPEKRNAYYIERRANGSTTYVVIMTPGERGGRDHLPHTLEVNLPPSLQITKPYEFVGAIEKVADTFLSMLARDGLLMTQLARQAPDPTFVSKAITECAETVRACVAPGQPTHYEVEKFLQPFVLEDEPTDQDDGKEALLRGSVEMVKKFATGVFNRGVVSTRELSIQMRNQRNTFGLRGAKSVSQISFAPPPAVEFVDAGQEAAGAAKATAILDANFKRIRIDDKKLVVVGDDDGKPAITAQAAEVGAATATSTPHPATQALLQSAAHMLSTLHGLAQNDPTTARDLAALLKRYSEPTMPTGKIEPAAARTLKA